VNISLYKWFKKSDSGWSLVRSAIIIAVLVFFVIGIINLGWVLNGYLTLNNAARTGVTIAVKSRDKPAALDEIKEAVKDHAGNFTFADDAIEVNFADEIGGETEVTATGELDLPVSFSPLPESVTLQGSAAMPQEK